MKITSSPAIPRSSGRAQQRSRREFVGQFGSTLASLSLLTWSGCVPSFEGQKKPDLIWGRRGFADGRLNTPRAMTIDSKDQLYIIDKTAHLQVFSPDGDYQRGWHTPEFKNGKPLGMTMGNDGGLVVADTHYFRVLFYSLDGQLDQSRTIGGESGDEPGQFNFVTDVVQRSNGNYCVGQYGQVDLIQEFDPTGKFIRRWGNQGSGPGEFSRPQTLVLDENGLLWIADACNHRIQVFDLEPKVPRLVKVWGSAGAERGQLKCPYGMDFDHDGTLLIAEYENHRIQRFSRDGESLEIWGTPGKEPGQFLNPWALIVDSKRRLHVLDSHNNRIQRFRLS